VVHRTHNGRQEMAQPLPRCPGMPARRAIVRTVRRVVTRGKGLCHLTGWRQHDLFLMQVLEEMPREARVRRAFTGRGQGWKRRDDNNVAHPSAMSADALVQQKWRERYYVLDEDYRLATNYAVIRAKPRHPCKFTLSQCDPRRIRAIPGRNRQGMIMATTNPPAGPGSGADPGFHGGADSRPGQACNDLSRGASKRDLP